MFENENDRFLKWWEEFQVCEDFDSLREDDQMDKVRWACAVAWRLGHDKASVVDAYNRGRLAMFLCWVIGAAAAVVVYFVVRFFS